MTREEQIREASIYYQLSTNPRAIGGDVFADMTREMNVNPSFIAGAIWSDNNPSPAEDIRPIPLTEKFFENNGIKKVDYDYLKPNVLFESDDKRIQVTDLTNSGDGYWNVHIDNEDFDTIGTCDVKYVHQFQQLLRLCGYEMDVII